MDFIFGPDVQTNNLKRRLLWALVWALGAANIAFSMHGLKQNAQLTFQGFDFVPLVSAGMAGWIFLAIICIALNVFCWLSFSTFITNPLAMPLTISQIVGIKGDGWLKFPAIAIGLSIMGGLCFVLYYCYWFDLKTTAAGLGIVNPTGPLLVPVAFTVFGPEGITFVIHASKKIEAATTGGRMGGGRGGNSLPNP
jgi:hypothetical protein